MASLSFSSLKRTTSGSNPSSSPPVSPKLISPPPKLIKKSSDSARAASKTPVSHLAEISKKTNNPYSFVEIDSKGASASPIPGFTPKGSSNLQDLSDADGLLALSTPRLNGTTSWSNPSSPVPSGSPVVSSFLIASPKPQSPRLPGLRASSSNNMNPSWRNSLKVDVGRPGLAAVPPQNANLPSQLTTLEASVSSSTSTFDGIDALPSPTTVGGLFSPSANNSTLLRTPSLSAFKSTNSGLNGAASLPSGLPPSLSGVTGTSGLPDIDSPKLYSNPSDSYKLDAGMSDFPLSPIAPNPSSYDIFDLGKSFSQDQVKVKMESKDDDKSSMIKGVPFSLDLKSPTLGAPSRKKYPAGLSNLLEASASELANGNGNGTVSKSQVSSYSAFRAKQPGLAPPNLVYNNPFPSNPPRPSLPSASASAALSSLSMEEPVKREPFISSSASRATNFSLYVDSQANGVSIERTNGTAEDDEPLAPDTIELVRKISAGSHRQKRKPARKPSRFSQELVGDELDDELDEDDDGGDEPEVERRLPLPPMPVVIEKKAGRGRGRPPLSETTLHLPPPLVLPKRRGRPPKHMKDMEHDERKMKMEDDDDDYTDSYRGEHPPIRDPVTVPGQRAPVHVYTKEERRQRLDRYRDKLKNRKTLGKRVIYRCRKDFADQRPRLGGRFIKKTPEEKAAHEAEKQRKKEEKKQLRLEKKRIKQEEKDAERVAKRSKTARKKSDKG